MDITGINKYANIIVGNIDSSDLIVYTLDK